MSYDFFLTSFRPFGISLASFSLLFAALTAGFAAMKGRNIFIWGALGGFFSCFPLIVLVFLPDENQAGEVEDPDSYVDGELASRDQLVLPPNSSDLGAEAPVWFYEGLGDDPHGPVAARTIHALYDCGELETDGLVWREGMNDWVPLSMFLRPRA